jgi:hypothetical protein
MEMAPELTPKRLAFLKELMPALTRVAILWQPGALHDETFRQILSSLNVTAFSGEAKPRPTATLCWAELRASRGSYSSPSLLGHDDQAVKRFTAAPCIRTVPGVRCTLADA